MAAYAAYVFDLDGTLYRGSEPIPHAVSAVERVMGEGARVVYLTNNSTQTRGSFVAKLGKMGFPVTEEMVWNSSLGAALYCAAQGYKTAHVLGEPGLKQTLSEYCISETNGTPDVVIVGLNRSLTYQDIAEASDWVRAGVPFVATNRDATFPLEGGRFIPGAGSVVSAVETAGGVTPFTVGKPNPYLLELILDTNRLHRSEVLVIGDRMDTDIEAGRRAGCSTLLVLTGVESFAPDGQTSAPDLRHLA